MNQQRLEQLRAALADDLVWIERRFRTNVKLTLVVRQPEVEGDAGIVISNDDFDAAIAEILKRRDQGDDGWDSERKPAR